MGGGGRGGWRRVLTVAAAHLVAGVPAVSHAVALEVATDTEAVITLELVRLAGRVGCPTQRCQTLIAVLT